MAKPKEKLISKTITKGRQGVIYKELIQIGERKLSIYIERDSYDFQSKAKIEVWDKAKDCWNLLANLHFGAMKTEDKLYYLPNNGGLKESHFTLDRAELVRQAVAVLDL